MGAVASSLKRVLAGASLVGSRAGSFFSHNQQLHTSRFGHLHEHANLLIQNPHDVGTGLLLGVSHFNQIACVRPTPKRRELGNMLVCAPPRSGKSLLAISQLLTWPHSVIVNDMKGELYAATADYRRLFSDISVIDFQGFGNCYDPLTGKTTEGALLSLATQLLYKADPDVQGAIFRRRAAEMAMLIWQAARIEGIAPFPYLRFLTRMGPEATAARLHSVSPELATQLLYTDYLSVTKEYFSDRFFLSCWGTLTATVRPLMTDPVIRSLTRSDFTPEQLMVSERPKTVYIRWKEQDMVTLSALNGLYWGSWINEFTSTHDQRRGRGCKPVLLLIDEGGRTAIPDLHDATATVCGRGVSIWLAVQSLEQLAEVYHSQGKADIILGNCDTQMFYRPNLLQTARYIEERLGRRSGFATSHTRYGSKEGSEGLSEQGVPVMAREEIMRMPNGASLVFHRDHRAMQLTQMVYSRYPVLAKRAATAAPPVTPLPPLADMPLRTGPAAPDLSADRQDEEIHLDDPATLGNPDDFD